MKAWQVCPHCRAVTFIWRDYDQRMQMAPLTQIHAAMLNNPDGSPCIVGEVVRCPACKAEGTELLASKWMRTGDGVPM